MSGSIHWFENEQTTYVFFTVQEVPERLIQPQFSLTMKEATAAGGTEDRAFVPIDFTTGVHLHRWQKCSVGTVCGSYSFRSERPIAEARLRFQYDANSPIDLTTTLEPFNHTAGDTFASYSALFYGIFDRENKHIAIETVHNFGTPQDSVVDEYGMQRSFKVGIPQLLGVGGDAISEAKQQANHPTIFPASICNAPATGEVSIQGRRFWLNDEFSTTEEKVGACFNVKFVDKNGAPLASASAQGFGRRNPELNFGQLTLKTPLRETLELHVLLKVCDGETYSGSLFDPAFYEYQKFILGMPGREPDVCFRVGSEDEFETNLSRHFADRLDQAKKNNPEGKDIVFVVMLHESFNREFKKVQAVVASQLTTIINAEREAITPRLVGGLVYSGSTNFQPTVLQSRYILWCPQELNENILVNVAALFNQNCTTARAQELNLQIINFVTPLGPFPSLEQYTKYRKDFGDLGLARNPDLKFYSVPTGPNTRQRNAEQLTFFDTERYTIKDNEYARFCLERNGFDSLFFRLRYDTMPAEADSLTVFELNNIWLSDDKPDSYQVGLSWMFPFVGRVNYTAALTGKALGNIPFSRSQRTKEDLADRRWFEESFDFGNSVQHCRRYCDNPYFDEGGAYQISLFWREPDIATCPDAQIPEWNGGGPV